MSREATAAEIKAAFDWVMPLDTEALAAATSLEAIADACGGDVQHVTASPVGNRVHVEPSNGNWFWRGGIFIRPRRHMYPKNAKQLARAVASCQAWCDRENAKDAAGRGLRAEVP